MRDLSASILVVILMLATCRPARAETVVIVNPGNPVASLSRDQVVDIYLGRQLNFSNGNTALPIDLPPDAALRSGFYRGLVGKSVAQINAYWARLLFTGRATPPRVLSGVPAILKSVRENRDAIAYVNSDDVDGKVKIVFRLK
jgi:hypothetical protein